MAEVGAAFVTIAPSARGFGSKLNSEVGGEIDGAGKTMGSRFGTAFKVGALALLAGAAFMGKFLADSIGEAREAEKITARTENVIKTMGNAAGITAKQVGDMAGRLASVTGIDDEAIQSGSNMLLTFGKVKNYVDGQFVGTFDRANALMVDMSAAMGTDMKSSALQLGKALNDPIKGVAALTRSGVSFTQQQKDQIAALQESGDILGAQNIILGEVERQFGGAAAAMATPADRLKVTFGNLKEQVGSALIPVVDRFLNLLLSAAPSVSAAIAGIGPAFGRIQAFIAPFVAQVQSLFSGGGGGGLLSGIQSFASSVATTFLPVLQTMAQTFTGVVLPAVTSLARYLFDQLAPVFVQIAGIITGQVLPIVASMAQFLYGTLYPAVIRIWSAVAQNLRPVFEALVSTFTGSVLPALESLLAKFREWQPTIQTVIGIVVKVIGKVLEFAAAILGKVLPPVIKFAGFLIGSVVPAVANVIGIVVKVIAKVIEFGSAVVGAVRTMIGWVKDKASDAWNFLKDKAIAAAEAILKPIQPIIDKLQALVSFVRDKAGGAWDGFKSAATGALNAIRDAVQWVIDKVQALIDKIQSIPGIPGGDAKGNATLVGGIPKTVVPSPSLSAPAVNPLSGGTDGAILAELRALRAAVLTVAPGVADGINGAVGTAQRSA